MSVDVYFPKGKLHGSATGSRAKSHKIFIGAYVSAKCPKGTGCSRADVQNAMREANHIWVSENGYSVKTKENQRRPTSLALPDVSHLPRPRKRKVKGQGFFGDLVNTGIHTLGPKLVDYGANAGANYIKKKLTGGSFAVPGGRLPARRGRVGTARRGRGIFSTIGSLADQFI